MRGLPRIQHFEDGGSDNSSPSSDSYSGWSDSASFSDFGTSWGDTTTSGNWSDSATWSDPGTSWSDAGNVQSQDTGTSFFNDSAFNDASNFQSPTDTGTSFFNDSAFNNASNFYSPSDTGTSFFSDTAFNNPSSFYDSGNYSPSFDTYSGAPYAYNDSYTSGSPVSGMDLAGDFGINAANMGNSLAGITGGMPSNQYGLSDPSGRTYDPTSPALTDPQSLSNVQAAFPANPYNPFTQAYDFLSNINLPSLNPLSYQNNWGLNPDAFRGMEEGQQGREGWNALGPGMTSFEGSPMGAQQVDETGMQQTAPDLSNTPFMEANNPAYEQQYQDTPFTTANQNYTQDTPFTTANPNYDTMNTPFMEANQPTQTVAPNVEVVSPSQVPASVMAANPAANLNQITQEQQQSPALNLEPVNVEAARDAQQVPQAPSNAQEVQAEAATAAAQAANQAAQATGAPSQSANAAAQAASQAVSRGADQPTTQQVATEAAYQAGANPPQSQAVGQAAADAAVQARDAVVQTASAYPTTTERAPDQQYYVPGGIPALQDLSPTTKGVPPSSLPTTPSFQTPQERSISPSIFSPLRGNEARAPAAPSDVPSTLSNLLDMLNPISRAEARGRSGRAGRAGRAGRGQAQAIGGQGPEAGKSVEWQSGPPAGGGPQDYTNAKADNPSNPYFQDKGLVWRQGQPGVSWQTAQQANITPKFQTGDHNWQSLSANLVSRLNAAYDAMPAEAKATFELNSGYRTGTRAEARSLGMTEYRSQESVWARSNGGRSFDAARPGFSNHGRGDAIDIKPSQFFGDPNRDALTWVQQHAGEFGLQGIRGGLKGSDPVHVELAPAGRSQVAGRVPAQAGRGPGGSQFANPGAPGRVTPHPGGPTFTFYGPGVVQDKAGRRGEGPFATANPDKEGKYVPHTLDDVRLGKSSYVTLAGSAANQGKSTNIGTVVYQSPLDNQWYTLNNVQAYVHDRGGKEFNSNSRLDVAVGDFTGKTNAQAAEFVSKNTMYPPGQMYAGSAFAGPDVVGSRAGAPAAAAQPTVPVPTQQMPVAPPMIPAEMTGPGFPSQAGREFAPAVYQGREGTQAEYGTNYGPGPARVGPFEGTQADYGRDYGPGPPAVTGPYITAQSEYGANYGVPPHIGIDLSDLSQLPTLPPEVIGPPMSLAPPYPGAEQPGPPVSLAPPHPGEIAGPPVSLAPPFPGPEAGPPLSLAPPYAGPETAGPPMSLAPPYPGAETAGPPLSLAPPYPGAETAGPPLSLAPPHPGEIAGSPFSLAPPYPGPEVGPPLSLAPPYPGAEIAGPPLSLAPPYPGAEQPGPPLSLAPEFAGAPSWDEAGMMITGKGDLSATPFDARYGDWPAPTPEVVGSAPGWPSLSLAGVPQAEFGRGPSQAQIQADIRGVDYRGVFNNIINNVPEAQRGDFGKAINNLSDNAKANLLSRGPEALVGMISKSTGRDPSQITSWINNQYATFGYPGYPGGMQGLGRDMAAARDAAVTFGGKTGFPAPSVNLADTQVAAQPTVPAPTQTMPTVPSPPEVTPSVPTVPPDVTPPSSTPPPSATPSGTPTITPSQQQDAREAARVDPQTAEAIIAADPGGVGDIVRRYGVDIYTAAMLLALLWSGGGMAEGGRVEDQRQYYVPLGTVKENFGKWPRAPTPDKPGYVAGYGRELQRRAAEDQLVATAAKRISSRLRINPENWDRFIRESPRSTNIEDRREKDETMGAGYQQGGSVPWGQDWGKESNDGWH